MMGYELPLASLDPSCSQDSTYRAIRASKRGAGVRNLVSRVTQLERKHKPNNPLPRLRGERVASLSELGEGWLLQPYIPFPSHWFFRTELLIPSRAA